MTAATPIEIKFAERAPEAEVSTVGAEPVFGQVDENAFGGIAQMLCGIAAVTLVASGAFFFLA